jgi:hypothetical protein
MDYEMKKFRLCLKLYLKLKLFARKDIRVFCSLAVRGGDCEARTRVSIAL